MEKSVNIEGHPWRWILHIFTVLYFTMSFVVRFTWPPVIPLAAPELGMQMSGAGAYMSAFFIGYVCTQIPGGVLGDRFGSRFVFFTALFIEGLGSIGVGLARSFEVGFLFRVITGLGGGMVYASCVRYIVSIFPKRELGLAFGFLLMAPSGVGVIVPNLLMPWLLTMLHWREAFIVVGGLGIGMSLLAISVVRDNIAQKQEGYFLGNLQKVLAQKRIILLGLVGFWLIWLTVGFITWGNTRVKLLGFTIEEAASVMIAFGLGGVVGSPLGGLLVQRVTSIRNALVVIFLILTPVTWAFYEAQTIFYLSLSAALLGFFIGLANPFAPMLTAQYFRKEMMGTAGGVTGCIYQLGAIIAPIIIGYSFDKTESFLVAWQFLSAVPFMAALTLLFLDSNPEQGSASQ